MTILELIDVSAGYGGKNVLENVSCRFERGRCISILGPNGCGKTTLLRAMAGLISHQGQILLDGTDVMRIRRSDLAGRIALMSQLNDLYFSYSVYDTVMLGRYRKMRGRLFSLPSPEDREAVERALRATGLEQMRDRSIDTLSGGQRQRVFLARTFVQDPEIILLDEPTNHLDVRYQVELIDNLRRWCREGTRTVIGVLHDINLALRLSREVIFMKEGQVRRQGDFHEVADRAFLTDIYGMDLVGFMRDSLENWTGSAESGNGTVGDGAGIFLCGNPEKS
ncbi:MAG: ABC transporter ATP-binding protein [Clostridia bacterium]|nr:ABC transporter ATP-binding protein [Clostridia bacterium]